jgi:hypothetical protein
MILSINFSGQCPPKPGVAFSATFTLKKRRSPPTLKLRRAKVELPGQGTHPIVETQDS